MGNSALHAENPEQYMWDQPNTKSDIQSLLTTHNKKYEATLAKKLTDA